MNKNQKGNRILLPVAIAVLGMLLSGCGGTDKPTNDAVLTRSGVETVNTPTVGLMTCTSCHTVQTADWMSSKHANVEPVGNLFSAGNPTLGQLAAAGCANCHDPQGDSGQLVAGYTGNTARPVIGCESCHSGGSLHVAQGGVGPIGVAAYTAGAIIGTVSSVQVSAQFATCTSCHELLDANDPASSPTLTPVHSAASGTNPTGTPYIITDTHFAQPNAWNALTGAFLATDLFAVTGYAMDFGSESVCIDCHNPHGTAAINQEWAQSAHGDRYTPHKDPQRYFTGAWSYYNWSCNGTSTAGCGSFGVPSSRKTCQRCHTTIGFGEYADALQSGDTALASQIATGAVSLVTYTAGYKPEMLKCNGCHSDGKGTLRNPGPITADYSYSTTTNNIAYKVSNASFAYPDVSKSNVCIACHTGVEAGETIQNLSLATAPSLTTMRNVGFVNSHYLTGGGTVFAATGYEYGGRSYDNPVSYQHNQIGMADFRSTGDEGPCVGCHMSRPNGNGNHLFLPVSRFNPVRYNGGTISVTANGATVTGASTAWTGAGIDTASDVLLGPDNRTYLIASVDSDTQITLASPYRGATASGQPYVIAKDGERIAGIASESCFSCHAGATSALVDQLNEERLMFIESLEALKFFLDKKGFCFIEAYPYFHRLRYNTGTVDILSGGTTVTGNGTLFTTNGVSAATDRLRAADGTAYEIQSVDGETQITLKTPYLGPGVAGSDYSIIISGSTNAVRNWDPSGDGVESGGIAGKNNMGAAFNFNLLEHDPGAYIHNRMYVKRLIYDSLDWIDDTALNYSVGTSFQVLSDAKYPWKAEAMTYLLPNGILSGIPAERP